MSKIRENRIKRWQEMDKQPLKEVTLVWSRDGKEHGFVIYNCQDYVGDAGRSSRVRVLWRDGKTTICCTKGMRHLDRPTLQMQII